MSKWHNKRTAVDNIVFDSIGEAHRYQDLKLLQSSGVISELTVKPSYVLYPKRVAIEFGERVVYPAIKHIPDYQYQEDGHLIVEDYKGALTDVWKIKHRLFIERYPHIAYRVTTREDLSK